MSWWSGASAMLRREMPDVNADEFELVCGSLECQELSHWIAVMVVWLVAAVANARLPCRSTSPAPTRPATSPADPYEWSRKEL